MAMGLVMGLASNLSIGSALFVYFGALDFKHPVLITHSVASVV
jgi:hypothetical protein